MCVVAYLSNQASFCIIGMSLIYLYCLFIVWKTERLKHQDVLFVDGIASNEPSKELECSICLQIIIPTQRWQIGCKHSFHYECIREYVSSHQAQKEVKCPLCRKKLNVIQTSKC